MSGDKESDAERVRIGESKIRGGGEGKRRGRRREEAYLNLRGKGCME